MRVIAFILASILSVPAIANPHGGTPVPPAALAVGYTTNTFSTSSSFSTSTVDTAGSYTSGFQWYLFNYAGAHGVTSADITINADGSITLLSGFANGTISSVAHTVSSPNYVGTAFGCGAYFTAELSFVPSTVNITLGWPAWWSLPLENITGVAQWSGQAAGYIDADEVDFFEDDIDPNSSTYGSAVHEYWGIFGSTCPPAYCENSAGILMKTPTLTDFTLYHRYAALWVPATNSTNGYVQFWFDDIPLPSGVTVSWTQYGTEVPPPTGQPWAFGVLDTTHLALILGTGSGNLTVRSVNVWQGSGACNMTH